jgi:hypothetical protein
MIERTRRSILRTIAALAATRWDNEGFGPGDVDGWEGPTGGVRETGEFAPTWMLTSGEGPAAMWRMGDRKFDERTLHVLYDHDGVQVDVEAEGDGVRGGALVELQPEQARELAVSLYQAAEEQESARDATGLSTD